MANFSTESFQFIDYIEMDSILSEKIWNTRNLPEIRKNMVNKSYISLSNHNKFLQSLKLNRNSLYYCVLSNGGGRFIGSVNIHFEESDTVERGIYLNPFYIGKGLSKKIVTEFYKYLKEQRGIKKIKTKVRLDNIPSNKLEKSLGAILIKQDDEYNYWLTSL